MQYGRPAYLDVTFLGVVQALSLFYTRRDDGVAHRDREERRLREIVGKLSAEDAEWVRNHIWVRPFPPLDDILAKLVREHETAMKPLFRSEGGFITEVINTANYFLRRDPEVGLLASRGAELYWLTAKLRILMKLCLLRELGFSDNQTHSFMVSQRIYKSIINHNSLIYS